jgi:hypothetical protein
VSNLHPLPAEVAAAPVCDSRVESFDFAATEIRLEAVTAAGRNLFAVLFGAGAVSISLPKSAAVEFARFAAGKGVTVA